MTKNTFPDVGITRIGHLRAEIQQIIEIWWPFWIMQIRYFPILGFLRTFSMVFWGPHRNSLWQKKICCNLFQVKPYFAWSTNVVPVCDCGERLTMSHLMTCVDAPNCSWTDLAMAILAGVNCAKTLGGIYTTVYRGLDEEEYSQKPINESLSYTW